MFKYIVNSEPNIQVPPPKKKFLRRYYLSILITVFFRNFTVLIYLNSATKKYFHRRWCSHCSLLRTNQVNHLHGIVCTGQCWIISYPSSTWRETLFSVLLCQPLTGIAENACLITSWHWTANRPWKLMLSNLLRMLWKAICKGNCLCKRWCGKDLWLLLWSYPLP